MSASKELLRRSAQRLQRAGIDAALLEVRHLLAFALGRRMSEVAGSADIDLTPAQEASFDKLLDRRAAREPLQRLLGRWDFWSLELQMGEAGLIPRPDSETLIEAVLSYRPDRSLPLRVLDLGTGTGCLLLSVLSEYPKALGLGIDIAPEAVALAAGNAARLGFEGRASFRQGDWALGVKERFDLVLSNPPYIPSSEIAGLEPEVACFEPLLALDGGADGLDAYRRIAGALPGLLAPDGLAVLELGAGQAASVAGLLEKAGLRVRELRPDLSGIERAILAEKRI
ncbi:MAG: peptide chain release factor N(5)-glutamine methyltransferase [Rhodospirillales bacterium]|nr:peptide chain release factor N(5)-glutamine methyltransferase [Rhodospirillales bacterium]